MQAHEPPSDGRKQDILRQALKRKTPLERAAFLDGACGRDAALRVEIEAWLTGHEGGERGPALNGEAGSDPPEEGATEITPTLLDETPLTEGPGTVIGRYKLLEQIGEGGFGVVYVAEQQEPVRRQVALKIIKLGMDTRQVVARFEAERQALALMDHPNIAKVFDGGATESGRPFFVMELVKGIPITSYCDQKKLGTRDRLDLFIPVCQAIQHAHQKGIIHRDIKPSNILVTLQEGRPVPKVIDFGIAKATQQRLTEKTLHTQLQQFIGTPAYMSPEQAEMSGLDIDTRSDIYSLGVLLYELLVGKTPFDAKELLAAGLDEIRRTIVEKEPARPSTRLSMMGKEELTTATQCRGAEAPKLMSLLRGDLDWIVMKCLEKDRTRRYDTANGLAMDIQRHLDNEPVVARPPSTAYRLQKAWRRNKLAFTAAAVVVAALVIGIGVSSWQAVEASRARNAEKEQRLAAQKERDKAQAAEQAEKQARLRADHLLYVADMNLAQQAWDQNNIGRLRQLLEDTQDSPDRGFEWYYWQAKTHLALKTLRGHLDGVRSVAFSPNGQRILTGSLDQTAKVWEAASGRELLTLKGHHAAINSVAFSPDGQRIATGSGDWPSDDHTAKVWEAASGKELVTLNGHTMVINSVGFSPDGQRIVTGSEDKTAKVWDAASGKELVTLNGHTMAFDSVGFSPDGQRMVTGSDDHTAKVWEAVSGKELLTFKGHGGMISSVGFSPDGQRIVTGSDDHTAKVWDVAGGLSADKMGGNLLTLKGHSDGIRSVAFSLDGQRIVSGGYDQTAKVWDAANGREILTLRGHSNVVSSVAFSPLDGRRIVTGSWDLTAKVWDAASSKELLTLNNGPIASVTFSPDGQRIVTGSWDATAKVWDAASGRELLTLKGHSYDVLSVAFSPDGQRIATASGDATAKVWEAATAQQVAAWQEEERAAAQYLAALQGERTAEQERQRIARDRDSIKQWLILAPIALATNQSGTEGLDIEQIEDEARLRPKAGEARSIGGGELKWREVALTNEVIDFNALLEHETTQSVAYAVCYIRSEAEQRGLLMLVGSDDEAKVYLNGKQVYKSPVMRPFAAEQDKVPDIALNAGLNVLVFKVVNETGDWKGSIRLTDAEGNPVKGIQVTLDPGAKEKTEIKEP